MKKKEMLKKGLYAAALTPLHEDFTCDIKRLVHHCNDLLQRGCVGVVLLGTTGEGTSFSLDEKKEILSKSIAYGLSRSNILLANGSSTIPETVELCKTSLEHGCCGMLIAPPCFYTNVKEEGVIAYYREIIQRVNHPLLTIILYHIPQYTGVPITLNIIQSLRAEFPEIVVGIKESEGNLDFTKMILKQCPGFKVYVGNEQQIIEAVQQGASGSISGIANLYPELICSLYQRGLERGLASASLDLLFKEIKTYPFIAAAKAFLQNQEGQGWERVRPPLVSLTEEEQAFFIHRLKNVESQL